MTSHEQNEKRQEEAMFELMATLDPPSHRVAQIEEAVLATVKPQETPQSLAMEWLELLRLRPIVTSGLALLGGAVLIAANPAAAVVVLLLLISRG